MQAEALPDGRNSQSTLRNQGMCRAACLGTGSWLVSVNRIGSRIRDEVDPAVAFLSVEGSKLTDRLEAA